MTRHRMTAHYAKITDQTVRRRWEQATKVNINGERVTLDPDGPLAQAQWAKTRYGMATQTLPNGYCGLPVQKSCPHANACLTCPVFLTGPEFLPELREQRRRTLTLIDSVRRQGPGPRRGDEPAGSHQPRPDDRRDRARTRNPRPPMRADNSRHVIAAARRRAEQTRQRAVAALRRMDDAGQPITFDAVAREAGVSRSWLYAQDDLRAEIERLRQRHPATPPAPVLPSGNGLRFLAAAPAGGGHRPHPPPGSREPATPRRTRPGTRRTPGRRRTRPDRWPRHAEEKLLENHRTMLNSYLNGPSTTPSSWHHRRSKT